MRTWLCLAGLAIACSTSDEVARPPPPAQLHVYVDDIMVAAIEPAQVATWPRLDTLVPVQARRLGMWETINIRGRADQSELNKPFDTYRDLVPVLFPGEGGAPAFGMFDAVELANKGKPRFREDTVREIRIKMARGTERGEHESDERGGSDLTKLELLIKAPTGDVLLTGDKLLAIKREPQPDDTGDEARGWRLATVLQVAGVKRFQRLLLTDAAGTNLTLEKADLDRKTAVPFIKLNRQGSLRFRVYRKQGTGWQVTSGLRALTKIAVVE
jgi:hypothetical protein